MDRNHEDEARREPARRDADAGLRAAHERFGGVDIPATLIGMLTALALLVILGGIVGGAISAFGYQTGLEEQAEEVSIAGLIAGLVVLFVSFLIGGWAAGRMARYDGVRNGLMVAVWAIILIAILSALGAWAGTEYDVLRNARLPQWFDRDILALGALISALVAIAVMVIAAILGGIWGTYYHRRADREILEPRTT